MYQGAVVFEVHSLITATREGIMPSGEMTEEEKVKAYRCIHKSVHLCKIPGCGGSVVCESKWVRNTTIGWSDAKEESRIAACDTCHVLYNAHASVFSRAIAEERS